MPSSKKARKINFNELPQNIKQAVHKRLQPQKLKGRLSRVVNSNATNTQKGKPVLDGKMFALWVIMIVVVCIFALIEKFNPDTTSHESVPVSEPSYEEYDLKGLTIKEACEKARGAGWEVYSITHIENESDKTDCYNENYTVSNYDYYKGQKKVLLRYGEKKTEEEKKAECEAEGKWYRNSRCKSEEEWEQEYKWQDAHSACKKYGASGYAKTLTDCYVGNEYMGPVDGQPAANSSSSNSDSSSNNSGTSASGIDSSKKYVLATIKDGENCPSNVQFCNIPGKSEGYPAYNYGYMRGKLINNSGKNYNYLQITADIYNPAGSKIGSCWGNISGLQAGESWEYEAVCDAWVSGASVKNGDVSGW